jgi:hypothetical protein
MELRDYPLEFVERTIDLIDKVSTFAKREGLDVTFLLNCTLGMIVATSENIELCDSQYFKKRICELESNKIFPTKIAYIDFNNDFKAYRDKINKTSLLTLDGSTFSIASKIHVNKYNQARNLTLVSLLKKIRNGVAHQNIMPINQDKVWEGVRIWNHNKYGIKDFEIEFKVSELKQFALFLARKYVSEFKRKKT